MLLGQTDALYALSRCCTGRMLAIPDVGVAEQTTATRVESRAMYETYLDDVNCHSTRRVIYRALYVP